MMPFTSLKLCVRNALILGFFVFCACGPAIAADVDKFVVQIEGEGHEPHPFRIELMQTKQQRAKGLMGRTKLMTGEGMLFDFGHAQIVRMWMHETLIPLDMLFIDDRGVVRYIFEQAQPLDRTIITSPSPVRWVLEVNGGVSQRLKIVNGDRITSKEVDLFRKNP